MKSHFSNPFLKRCLAAEPKSGKTKKAAGGKTKRAKKDKNAPKRPRTAFLCFSIERRPVVSKENPELGFGEVAKAVSAEWKELSDKERKVIACFCVVLLV